MSAKSLGKIAKCTFSEFGEDNVTRLSAALAYYSMFSIGPLLVIAVGLAGFAFGHDAVRTELTGQLRGLIGENSTKMIESMMTAQRPGAGLITTMIGLAEVLFGAAGVFGQLQDSLNTIWGVKSKPGKGMMAFLRA